MIAGFLLIPFFIGFQIIIIGVMIFSFGLIKYFYSIFCIIKKVKNKYYSSLNASIGSNLEARLAGSHPDKSPTKKLIIKLKIIE